jgi:5-methylcytosine-specific restriction endonuclease McrA
MSLQDMSGLKETLLVLKDKRKGFPKAVREQVWLKICGKVYEHKCYVKWCNNIITVYDFEIGHNIPHSKGGSDTIDNLFPLCSRCNKSMNDNYTIDEFVTAFAPPEPVGKNKSCICM